MNRMYETLLWAAAFGLVTSIASAQGVSLSASASTDTGADADASADAPGTSTDADDDAPLYPADGPWGAEGNTWEFGLYWGLFFPSSKHELFEVSSGFKELESVTPELGLRAAYYPWRVFGLEVEGGMLPTQTKATNQGANIFTLRGHAILQAPTTSLVPFLLVGGGMLAESSEPTVLGSDVDPALHVGVGVKGYVTDRVAVRFDVRDNFTRGLGKDEIAMHWEALLGLSLTIGRNVPPAPPPPPPDADSDGVADDADKCPGVVGVAPDGCPPDADGDLVPDTDDACPNEPGFGSKDPTKNGCPPPPPDCDGDGVPDHLDKCPGVLGDGPDGCVLDADADGVRDRDDKCPTEPETKNGFEDQDGCPDELPEEVKKFTGVIEGIVFDANKATIRQVSFPKLDEAVKVLTDYPTLRMQISGHTDTSGKADRNMALSAERAEAVKTYFVSKGVAAERIETLGAGSTVPIGDNATKEGRAMNRRIEFKVLQ